MKRADLLRDCPLGKTDKTSKVVHAQCPRVFRVLWRFSLSADKGKDYALRGTLSRALGLEDGQLVHTGGYT